jgi:hypothetical protein
MHPIDRDILLVPEEIIQEYENDIGNIGKIMKPIFDTIWNSTGLPGSFNYNNKGEWIHI